MPSLVIAMLRSVHASPHRLLSTMSNRILGDAPNAVALRRNDGEKSSSAIADRSRSTKALHFAYDVSGLIGLLSSTVPSATP